MSLHHFICSLPAFFSRTMISVDHKPSSIGLMQSFQQQPTPSSSSVNHFQSPASSSSSSSTCTIYDNNHPLQLTEKKSLSSSSSRVRRSLPLSLSLCCAKRKTETNRSTVMICPHTRRVLQANAHRCVTNSPWPSSPLLCLLEIDIILEVMLHRAIMKWSKRSMQRK